jgi:thioredoxin 1
MKLLTSLLILLLSITASAADGPYNEAADAKLAVKQALAQAVVSKKPVIVVFGANWCGDCKALDAAMKHGASAPLILRDFEVVKVDVGHFNKNLDLAKSYGVPLQKGIPAVVVLSPANKVLHATRDGELANARSLGDQGIYTLLKRMAAGS